MDLITFDLDETLVKAKKCHFKAFNKAFKKFNLKKVSYKKLKPLLNGRHAHDVVKILFPSLPPKKLDKVVNEHHKLIATEYGKYAEPIKGVVSALKKIKRKYKLGIATNCTHREISGLLKGAKINERLFSVIIGKDDVRKSKPAPNELLKAKKLTGANIKFHVGDSPYDIIAGRKAKIKVIAVLTGVSTRKILKKEKPYKIIRSVKELIEVVM